MKPKEVTCECGWKVKGNSISNAEANLKIHRTSKMHKKLMEMKR